MAACLCLHLCGLYDVHIWRITQDGRGDILDLMYMAWVAWWLIIEFMSLIIPCGSLQCTPNDVLGLLVCLCLAGPPHPSGGDSLKALKRGRSYSECNLETDRSIFRCTDAMTNWGFSFSLPYSLQSVSQLFSEEEKTPVETSPPWWIER